MKTIAAFYQSTRTKFPDLTEKADRQHIKYWDELPTEAQELYIWFESVSRALNNEMRQGTYVKECKVFFQYIEGVFRTGSDEVKNCIDVAFVENLFWEVSPNKGDPYWQVLPEILQKLYVNFHARTPL